MPPKSIKASDLKARVKLKAQAKRLGTALAKLYPDSTCAEGISKI